MDLDRIKRLTKEIGWVIFGQIVAVVGTLALVRVLTERLSPDIYGLLALGLTLAGLANQVIMGGITVAVARYYPIAVESQSLAAYFQATKRLLVIASLVILASGFFLVAGLWVGGSRHWVGLAALITVFSLLTSYGGACGAILNAARRRALVAVYGGLDACLKVVLTIALLYWLGISAEAVVSAYIFSALIIIVAQYRSLRLLFEGEKKAPGDGESHWRRQMKEYSWPFISWGIFTWAQQISDRWALELYGSTEAVGFYVVLFQLGYAPIVLVVGMAVSFLSPIFFQRAGDATDHQRRSEVRALAWRIVMATLALTLLAFTLTFILHEWLFSFLVSSEYRSISYLMPWMVAAGGVFAMGQMLALRLMSDMRAKAMTKAKICTALFGGGLNLLGAAQAGIEGVVASLLFASVVYTAWMLFLAIDIRH